MESGLLRFDMEYKINLNKEEIIRMDEACDLYKNGDFLQALPILKNLSESNPTSPMLKATLANLYWELEKVEIAIKLFYEAVELGAKSEKISRGLMQILWEQQKEAEAVNEIQRFINTGEASKEYIDMALEINNKREFNITI